ncbi:MAG: DJ-1/PfpI family protein [bacterium]
MTNNKRVALIIAFKDFRDEEYFIPKNLFKSNGIKTITISNEKGTALGVYGGEAKVDLLLSGLILQDYDAVVFIGGAGALKYLDNQESYRIAEEVVANNKVLAAICISSVILAKAGVLKGKKATVWSSSLDKTAVKTLEENGAIYFNLPVVTDGRIVTATGPAAADKFAEQVIKLLRD